MTYFCISPLTCGFSSLWLVRLFYIGFVNSDRGLLLYCKFERAVQRLKSSVQSVNFDNESIC